MRPFSMPVACPEIGQICGPRLYCRSMKRCCYGTVRCVMSARGCANHGMKTTVGKASRRQLIAVLCNDCWSVKYVAGGVRSDPGRRAEVFGVHHIYDRLQSVNVIPCGLVFAVVHGDYGIGRDACGHVVSDAVGGDSLFRISP